MRRAKDNENVVNKNDLIIIRVRDMLCDEQKDRLQERYKRITNRNIFIIDDSIEDITILKRK